MSLSQTRVGEIYTASACLLWSAFPILVNRQLNPFSPFYTAALSTFFALIPTAILMTVRRRWPEVLLRRAWLPILYGSLLIGFVFYAFVFVGAQMTSPGNVALLGLMEIPFAFLLLRGIKSEKASRAHVAGAALMFSGAALLLLPAELLINSGDICIIVSCLLPPYGNLWLKRARGFVSSETLLFLRSLISAPLLLLLSFLFEAATPASVQWSGLKYVAINGILLMGIQKILWSEGMYRLPLPKATTFVALGPASTLLLAYLILGIIPSGIEIASLLPISGGLLLLVSRGQQEQVSSDMTTFP